ncbi:hypothetical protein ACFQMA_17555 [Halosimplex aquaticum]|uniref:DUF7577 domain-containing protein n=1 Tax=Halosimplex aquaticum TaxID=3026162 RepID=A0ABD5Y2P0_9EURY|nr:hypothetical protein [Halosimplex aquaticum]
MASLVVFLAMVFAAGLALGVVAMGAWLALGRVAAHAPRNDEVLPSHYSTLVSTTPSKYPGYCPDCGTNNDPEYSVCKNCSSKLPESRYERSKGAPNSFLNQ